MAVRAYQTETGETLWKAYVCVRSQVNSAIRVQRWKFGCKTEKQAEREESQLLKDCQREVFEKERRGQSWGAVVEAWEVHLKNDLHELVADTSRDDYVAALSIHTALWWKRSAAEITKADVTEMLAQLKANGASNSFLYKMKNTVSRVFTFGMERNLIKGIDRAPTFGIKVKKKEEKKPEILTLPQMQKLLIEAQRLDSRWYPIWATALLTGMRSGELYALQWSDVDWENRQITVSKSYNCRRKLIKSTKNGEWRDIPISKDLMTLLLELKSETGNRTSVLPRPREWMMGCQANKLREFCMGIGLPSIRFHALRACFATQLIRSGIAPIRIQKICGWSDLETMQRYIRLAGIEIEGATEGLKVLPETEVMERAGALLKPEKEGKEVAA